jgi:hypothetical protein
MNKKPAGNNLCWATPLLALGALGVFAQSSTANPINFSCNIQSDIPVVTATFLAENSTKDLTFLNFLPEYFSASEALENCQNTARSLQSLYEGGNANYLTADELNGQPAVCTVQRRGTGCDHYSAELLFTLHQGNNPAQVLYNMLGNDFKQSDPLNSRTLGRIYSDIKPSFWQRLWY